MGGIVFVELPVKDLSRAYNFYKEIFKKEMNFITEKGIIFMLEVSSNQYIGCLKQDDAFIPNLFGPIIYFNTIDKPMTKISNIENFGGKIISISNKTPYMEEHVIFRDSENNILACTKI